MTRWVRWWAAIGATALALPGVAAAQTLTVCPSGCTSTTIGGALAVAHDSDTVDVHAGTYAESVTVAAQNLTLQGDPAGPRPVITLGSGQTVLTLALGATVRHFEVDNTASSGNGLGISFPNPGAGITLSDLSVSSQVGEAINAFGAYSSTIGPRVMVSTTAATAAEALAVGGSGNTILGVQATATHGPGALVDGEGTTVMDSAFSGGSGSAGLELFDSYGAPVTVRRVTASGGAAGIQARGALITDTVARSASGPAVEAIVPNADGESVRLENVTALGGSAGLQADPCNGGARFGSISAVNTIARASTAGGTDVFLPPAATCPGSIQIGYSAFATRSAAVTDQGHETASPPPLVGGGDAHLTGPFVTGTADSQTGTSDRDGVRRPLLGEPAPTVGAFEPPAHTLTIGVTGAGSGSLAVDGQPCATAAACSGPYLSGSTLSLTAAPAPGSVFGGWTGGCGGTASCTVKLIADAAVSAAFNPRPPHTVSVILSGTGTGRVIGGGIDCPAVRCSVSVPDGTALSLVASPGPGSRFGSWSGACAGSAECQLTAGADRSAGASFVAVPAAAPIPRCTIHGARRLLTVGGRGRRRTATLHLTVRCDRDTAASLTGSVTLTPTKRGRRARRFALRRTSLRLRASRNQSASVALPSGAVVLLSAGRVRAQVRPALTAGRGHAAVTLRYSVR